jgi:hypothetical protein
MRQEGIARQHRILLGAKARQGMGQKVIQRQQRLAPRHPPPERPQPAEVAGKPRLDQGQNLFGHRIGGKPRRARAKQVGRGRAAVLGVIVPAPAGGLVAFHQEPGAPPHLAVEPLHPQFIAAPGPKGELGLGAQETVVGQDPNRQRQVRQQAAQPPVAGLGGQHLHGPGFRGPADQLAADRLAVVRIVQPRIGHPPALRAQGFGMVAHRRQDQRNLLRVVGDIVPLGHHLGHHHDIARRIGRAQRRQARRQLVAQHQHQARAYHGIARPA